MSDKTVVRICMVLLSFCSHAYSDLSVVWESVTSSLYKVYEKCVDGDA